MTNSKLKIGDKVIMNDRYRVSDKNKGVVFEVLSEPWRVCGTDVVKISGRSGGYAVDGLTKVGEEEWLIGEPILCYGKSGSGKSRSLKNFGEDEILFINTISKRLPFPQKFKYELRTKNYALIKDKLMKMPCKVAVVDDAGYLMTSTFMAGHSNPKKGGSTFDLFNQIGDEFWDLILFVKEKLPEDVFVYFMMHEISNDYGEIKVRTIGKLLDEKVCIEGMFTICLHCMTDGTRHYFKTQGGTMDIAKSPEEMFDLEIENDLKAVDTRAREYWGITAGDTDGT